MRKGLGALGALLDISLLSIAQSARHQFSDQRVIARLLWGVAATSPALSPLALTRSAPISR
eukprot:4436128-Alexandrium_andersonii.AAC.1